MILGDLGFPIIPQRNTLTLQYSGIFISSEESIKKNDDLRLLYNFIKQYDEIQSAYLTMSRFISIFTAFCDFIDHKGKTAKTAKTANSKTPSHSYQ